jgi:arginine deiminase
MPIGNGVVLIGMGERSSRQAIGQLARNLFKNKAVERVIVAGLPKSRAAMHLDTVFSFCDRDLVTIFPEVVNQIVPSPCALTRASPTALTSNGRKPTSSTPWPQPLASRPCV